MADRDRLRLERTDDPGIVFDDCLDPVAGDAVGLLPRLLDRVAVSGPARRRGLVTRRAELLDPGAPRVGVQPEAVNEDDRSAFRGGHDCTV
jgi:hypothetical protein